MLESAGTQRHVVFLTAGEILQGEGELIIGNGAQITLQAILKPD